MPLLTWLLESSAGPWITRKVLGRPTKLEHATDHEKYDYNDDSSWAVLPSKSSFLCQYPDTTQPPESEKKADCFYIHPTSFYNYTFYNEPIHDSAGDSHTKMHLTTIAQPFSESCRVFAPLYRQQSLASLFETDPKIYEQSSTIAFNGILAAWRNFLTRRGDDKRPIVLASHSQGSFHMVRLLQEIIDVDDKLAAKVVAVYAIGGLVQRSLFDHNVSVDTGQRRKDDTFRNFHISNGPTDTHCVIAFNLGKNGFGNKIMTSIFNHGGLKHRSGWARGPIETLQVNPLTWTETIGVVTEGKDGAEKHLGGIKASYNPPRSRATMLSTVKVDWGVTATKGVAKEGGKPITLQVQRNCLKMENVDYEDILGVQPASDDLHVHEYGLFYYQFKNNVEQRIAAYLENNVA